MNDEMVEGIGEVIRADYRPKTEKYDESVSLKMIVGGDSYEFFLKEPSLVSQTKSLKRGDKLVLQLILASRNLGGQSLAKPILLALKPALSKLEK